MSLGAYNSLSKTDINWRLVGVAGGLFSRVNERQTPLQSASKRAAEEVSAAFSSWLHSLIYPLEKQTCQQRRLNLNRKDRSVRSFRAGITNFFSSDAMKSCNSGRERWSGNSCPNSVDRRGTDKPWSEHQEGIKVEKNNRELNVWVNSEYRLCEKFELCKLRCTFLKIEYAVTMQSANWINNRARNFC